MGITAETNKNICNFCTNYNCTHKNEMYRERCDFFTPIAELGFAMVTIDQWHKYQQFKADYETRLKADLVAILTELQLEIEELDPNYECNTYYAAIRDCSNLTQQKIDKLKENTDGNNY